MYCECKSNKDVPWNNYYLVAMGFHALYVWMGVNFVLAVIVWHFYPETKGK